jgi:glycosyltransferase involved in cell wall biosynthesis
VPEHVRGTWPGGEPELRKLNPAAPDRADGVLVPPGSPRYMAAAVEALAAQPGLREQLGANGAREAAERFGLDRQVDAYLAWYEEIRSAAR